MLVALMRALFTCSLVLGLVVGEASFATAQSEARGVTSTLSWTRLPGAEACPTVVDIAAEVEAILGPGVLVDAAVADRIVEASVEAIEGAYVARIRVSGGDGTVLGERELRSTDPGCADLRETAPLVIALMIDPDAEARVRAAPDPPPVTEPPAPREPIVLTLDLGASATLGVGPFVSGAGYFRALLVVGSFVPIGIVGILQPFSRTERASLAGTDFLAAYGGLTICPLFHHQESVSLGLCAGLDVGGAGVLAGAMSPAERERIMVQLDVQAYLRWTLWGPLQMNVLAAFFVPFRTEPFRDASGVTWAPEPVAGMLGLGLSLDLVVQGEPFADGHALGFP